MHIIEKYLKQEDYENNDKEYIYYVFLNKIAEITGEGILPHHEFTINYDEKYCIFNDYEIEYGEYDEEETLIESYKIILKPKEILKSHLKKLYSSFNIFILKKIQ